MYRIIIAIFVLSSVSFLGCGGATSGSGTSAEQPKADKNALPIDVVNKRMEAYNHHDLDSFLNLYSNDVEIFTYPDKLLGKGKSHLRSIFEPMFQQKQVQVEIHGQFTKDSYVINNETVTDGEKETKYLSIYKVKDGLIRSVRFVRD